MKICHLQDEDGAMDGSGAHLVMSVPSLLSYQLGLLGLHVRQHTNRLRIRSRSGDLFSLLCLREHAQSPTSTIVSGVVRANFFRVRQIVGGLAAGLNAPDFPILRREDCLGNSSRKLMAESFKICTRKLLDGFL